MCAAGSHEITFAPRSGKSMMSLDAADQRHQVAVGELDALRRAGRPRRVDQRQHVVGLELVDDRGRVELGIHRLDLLERVGAAVAVDDDHVLDLGQVLRGPCRTARGTSSRRSRPCAGVGAHVLDLLGRGGLVDRERDASEGDGGEVARDELGAVVEHDRDRVALAHAELGEAAGDPVHALAELVPVDRVRIVLGADRRVVAEAVDRLVEGLDQVRSRQLAEIPTTRVPLRSRDLHQLLLSSDCAAWKAIAARSD